MLSLFTLLLQLLVLASDHLLYISQLGFELHLVMHWPHNHVYLSRHIYEGHTDQNAPLLGKYGVDYLHISPNCNCIMSSILKSHAILKTNYSALKIRPKEHLVKN